MIGLDMENNKENNKKRYVVRNIAWNKHYQNEDFILAAETMLNLLKKDHRIQYCIFTIERGKDQDLSKFHLQGYIDFNRTVDANVFKAKYSLSYAEKRISRGQKDAIDYVRKTDTKISDRIYEFGEFKKELSTFNVDDKNIPSTPNLQRVELDRRISSNYYKKFEDIKQDFTIIYLNNRKWCKNL